MTPEESSMDRRSLQKVRGKPPLAPLRKMAESITRIIIDRRMEHVGDGDLVASALKMTHDGCQRRRFNPHAVNQMVHDWFRDGRSTSSTVTMRATAGGGEDSTKVMRWETQVLQQHIASQSPCARNASGIS